MHSNLVFSPPFETNFDFPTKQMTFKTIIQTPSSGRGEIRASRQPFPTWQIEYSLQHARGSEREAQSVYGYMLGFFGAMGGQASDFLYMDPNDHIVEAEELGIGDGVTTTFQLMRTIGIFRDIVQNPGQTPTLIVSANGQDLGEISSDNTQFMPAGWNVGYNGIVQFDTPPGNGVVLTWSGSFYYRVRFADESSSFDQMFQKIWENQSIKLLSVIL